LSPHPPDWSVEPFDTSGWNDRLATLYAHWRALPRGGRRFPARAAFDPFDIPDALGALWLLDIERDPFRLRYRLVGTRIVAAVGEDATGRYLDELPNADPERPLDLSRFRLTADTGAATWARTRPHLLKAATWTEVENLVLPLAADGETPDILLCASVFYKANGDTV